MYYGGRSHQIIRRTTTGTHKKFVLNKAFQYKYSWYLVTAVAGATLMFLVPAYYFISQNYQIFSSLAYETSPGLVKHLDRELIWLKCFMAVSFFSITGISMFLCMRMTKNLVNPLILMEKHMRQLMLGQWHIADFKMTEDDDFRDLSMTYDYFYRALRANTEIELKLIEKLSIDPQNREAYASWKNLMEIKRTCLGISDSPIGSDATMNVPQNLHRAS